MKRSRKWRIVLAATLCLTLLLTACAGTPDAAKDSMAETTLTPETSAPTTTKPTATVPDTTAEPVTEQTKTPSQTTTESVTEPTSPDETTEEPIAPPTESTESTEPTSESPGVKPWTGKVNERTLQEAPEEITQTEPVYRWSRESSVKAFKGGRTAADFFYHELSGIYLLQGDDQMLLTGYFDWFNQFWELPCTNPRRFVVNMETEGLTVDSEWVKAYYILCDEGVLRIPQTNPRKDLDMKDSLLIPLPEGVGPEDVIDFTLHDNSGPQSFYSRNIYPLLVTNQKGNYMLDPTSHTWRASSYGYQIVRTDEETLEIRTSRICWRIAMPSQQVWVLGQPTEEELVFCTKAEEESRAYVYHFTGEDCQVSVIDMTDWVAIPNCFAKLIYGEVYLLAAKEEEVELLRLIP